MLYFLRTPNYVGAVAPTRPNLSVVLSFFNEGDVIPELVSRLRKALGALEAAGELAGHELIFINDASTDNSRELLESLSAGHDDIRLLNMSRNFGGSTCALAGMEYASGDLLVYMDSDLQDPPETIPEMLAAYKAGGSIDVVHTVRRSRAGETKIKLLITRLGYFILKYLATIRLDVEAGDFKLLSRRAVNHLIQIREKRPYLRGLVSWIGFNQTTVYYNREPRFAGSTKFAIFGPKVIANFFSSALIAFSDLPLQFSSWIGAFISLLSAMYSAWLLVKWLLGWEIPSWALPLAIVAFLSGVQLFCIGLLGLYIAAIHVESKRRPNYIVESTSGFGYSPSPNAPLPNARN